MLDLIHDSMMEAQFKLRQGLLGQVRLRQGLPRLPEMLLREGELEYYRRVLERSYAHKNDRQSVCQVVDVGCRNWSYVRALARFFNNAHLLGVEVDGWRRYWNLHRRKDYADAYAAELRAEGREVQTFFGDFADLQELPTAGPWGQSPERREILFCFFFPFVSENPCRSWGLPSRFVKFKELVLKAQTLVASKNQHSLNSSTQCAMEFVPRLLSVHQGEWEAEEARQVYSELGLTFKESTLHVEEFKELWPSPYENRIFLV